MDLRLGAAAALDIDHTDDDENRGGNDNGVVLQLPEPLELVVDVWIASKTTVYWLSVSGGKETHGIVVVHLRFVENAGTGKEQGRHADTRQDQSCFACVGMNGHSIGNDTQHTKSVDVQPAQEARLAMLEQNVNRRLHKDNVDGQLGHRKRVDTHCVEFRRSR